jgi:hypothetical protein
MAHLLRIAPAAILPASMLLTACSTHAVRQQAAERSSAPTPAATATTAAPTLEELGSKTGCDVQVQTNATQLRQGACTTSAGRFVVLTFPTDKDAATWLTEAKIWGGHYLVGKRWVVVGTAAQLSAFQKKLGGTVQLGDSH